MSENAVLVIGEAGADPQRLDLLAGYLRSELEALDGVSGVARAVGEPAPPGARGLELAAVGSLVVALARSDALRGVIDAIRRWLDRSPQAGRSIRVEIGGDVLELSNATSKTESELVTLFVTRHS